MLILLVGIVFSIINPLVPVMSIIYFAGLSLPSVLSSVSPESSNDKIEMLACQICKCMKLEMQQSNVLSITLTRIFKGRHVCITITHSNTIC